ncbi:MAG: hypothetical protein MRJ68_17050, partial [Nitrospira sp.]|nr:hypothetical protein [Nitrospira sp.]
VWPARDRFAPLMRHCTMTQRDSYHSHGSLRAGARVVENSYAVNTNLVQHVPTVEGEVCNLLN